MKITAAGLLVLLAACAGPTFVVQQYAGDQRPAESIAVLRVVGNQPVRLLFLDEQDVAAPIVEDGRLHIEILPARHTIVVGNAAAPNERYLQRSFDAEPGRYYRVTFVANEPHVFEVDRGKDSLLRDVTILPPAASPPAIPASVQAPPASGQAPPASVQAPPAVADAGAADVTPP